MLQKMCMEYLLYGKYNSQFSAIYKIAISDCGSNQLHKNLADWAPSETSTKQQKAATC
jgi:hypothetical protein